MTVPIQITIGGVGGAKIAVDAGHREILDENMEILREGKEAVAGVTTSILEQGHSLVVHLLPGHELVVRQKMDE